ncbi:MAG: hypothetical protein BWX70_02389 [Verrucomicrobia bacterium ADurb.Bin070]|nr:MAG: hypothetical protein BWX70_02389 [Verrucomicrobia bacterium ADurb.Bin070]
MWLGVFVGIRRVGRLCSAAAAALERPGGRGLGRRHAQLAGLGRQRRRVDSRSGGGLRERGRRLDRDRRRRQRHQPHLHRQRLHAVGRGTPARRRRAHGRGRHHQLHRRRPAHGRRPDKERRGRAGAGALRRPRERPGRQPAGRRLAFRGRGDRGRGRRVAGHAGRAGQRCEPDRQRQLRDARDGERRVSVRLGRQRHRQLERDRLPQHGRAPEYGRRQSLEFGGCLSRRRPHADPAVRRQRGAECHRAGGRSLLHRLLPPAAAK